MRRARRARHRWPCGRHLPSDGSCGAGSRSAPPLSAEDTTRWPLITSPPRGAGRATQAVKICRVLCEKKMDAKPRARHERTSRPWRNISSPPACADERTSPAAKSPLAFASRCSTSHHAAEMVVTHTASSCAEGARSRHDVLRLAQTSSNSNLALEHVRTRTLRMVPSGMRQWWRSCCSSCLSSSSRERREVEEVEQEEVEEEAQGVKVEQRPAAAEAGGGTKQSSSWRR
mmetsp:Transcript_41124/g.133815  ORF Transcript_41124/g.133815 Transcript_41124/m.133815 type:complete len:230 (-) Transcript_41124:232-921(-)